MSEKNMLLDLIRVRHGDKIAEEILSKCNFVKKDKEDTKILFKESIKFLDDFVAVRRAHLSYLKIFDPCEKFVYSYDNVYINEPDLDAISSEVGAMRKIFKSLE